MEFNKIMHQYDTNISATKPSAIRLPGADDSPLPLNRVETIHIPPAQLDAEEEN